MLGVGDEAEEEDGDAGGDAREEREAEDDHVGGAGVAEEAGERVGHGQGGPAEEEEEEGEGGEVAGVGGVGGGAEHGDDGEREEEDEEEVEEVPGEGGEPVEEGPHAAHVLQALLLGGALAHHVDDEAGGNEGEGAEEGERDADVGDLAHMREWGISISSETSKGSGVRVFSTQKKRILAHKI